ncbi:MAG: hypothetical protein WDW38_006666 [Sanguina aurantia]
MMVDVNLAKAAYNEGGPKDPVDPVDPLYETPHLHELASFFLKGYFRPRANVRHQCVYWDVQRLCAMDEGLADCISQELLEIDQVPVLLSETPLKFGWAPRDGDRVWPSAFAENMIISRLLVLASYPNIAQDELLVVLKAVISASPHVSTGAAAPLTAAELASRQTQRMKAFRMFLYHISNRLFLSIRTRDSYGFMCEKLLSHVLEQIDALHGTGSKTQLGIMNDILQQLVYPSLTQRVELNSAGAIIHTSFPPALMVASSDEWISPKNLVNKRAPKLDNCLTALRPLFGLSISIRTTAASNKWPEAETSVYISDILRLTGVATFDLTVTPRTTDAIVIIHDTEWMSDFHKDDMKTPTWIEFMKQSDFDRYYKRDFLKTLPMPPPIPKRPSARNGKPEKTYAVPTRNGPKADGNKTWEHV